MSWPFFRPYHRSSLENFIIRSANRAKVTHRCTHIYPISRPESAPIPKSLLWFSGGLSCTDLHICLTYCSTGFTANVVYRLSKAYVRQNLRGWTWGVRKSYSWIQYGQRDKMHEQSLKTSVPWFTISSDNGFLSKNSGVPSPSNI